MPTLKSCLVVGCLAIALWSQRGGPGQVGQRPAAAPLETDPKRLCKIEGRAVNALTGEPIQRASVTLAGSGGNATSRSTRSDGDGRFLIENIQPGVYRLTVERFGFLRQAYGARTAGGSAASLNLPPGQTLKGVEMKLTPQGVILGKVLDDEGDPLPRTSVAAYRLGGLGATPQSRQAVSGSAATNDIGEYRLASLAPGRYVVVATSQARGGGRLSDTPDEDLLPTYYPSTLEPAGAVPIEVTAGQEVGGITIMLKRGALYRVQGKIAGGTPQDLANVRVSLLTRGGGPSAFTGRAGAAVGPDGAFQVTRVQPGSYYLIAQRMGRQAGGIVGRISVELTGGDARGLILPLAEPMTVSGTVRIEGDQKTSPPRLTVSLISIDGLPVNVPRGRVAETGVFKLDSVSADNYYVTFYGLPEGAYVKSVRVGNQEALDKGVDLTNSRGSVSLDVILSPKAGSVEGVVMGQDKPAAGSSVVMLADPIRAGQPYLNKSATADQDGRFTMTGVAPGAYRLYAWEEDPSEVLREPGLAKPFEPKSVSVSVEESGTQRVELKVLKP